MASPAARVRGVFEVAKARKRACCRAAPSASAARDVEVMRNRRWPLRLIYRLTEKKSLHEPDMWQVVGSGEAT